MYVSKQDRDRLDPLLEKVVIVSTSELCYAYQKMALNLLDIATGKLNEGHLLGIVGALDMAKAEFKRRVIDGNNVHVVRTNGDLYQDFIRRRNLVG